MSPLDIECPACEQTFTAASGWLIVAATEAHDARCPGRPREDRRRLPLIRVECEHCGRHLGDVSNSFGRLSRQVSALQSRHDCPTGRKPTAKYGADEPQADRPPCSVQGCVNQSRVKGMCETHYRRGRRAQGLAS